MVAQQNLSSSAWSGLLLVEQAEDMLGQPLIYCFLAGALSGRLLSFSVLSPEGKARQHRQAAAYVFTSVLAAFMISWILFLPSTCSWIWSDLHKQLVEKYVWSQPTIVPDTFNRKYVGKAAVCLSHTIPAAVWSLAIPFQIHPASRKHYPTLHRWVGRIFLAISALMMYGYYLIEADGLGFHTYDFPDIPKHESGSNIFWSSNPHVSSMAMIFLVTGSLALFYAAKPKPSFAAHRRWISRHLAAGLWVSLQRMLLSLPSIFVQAGYRFSPAVQKGMFMDAAFLAAFVTGAVAEVAILDSEAPTTKSATRKAD